MPQPPNPNLSGALPGHVTGQFTEIDAALRAPSGELETYRGITRDLRSGRDVTLMSGYIVSDSGGTHVPHSEYKPSDLGPFVAERQKKLLDPGGRATLGVFVDGDTVDTDVSRHYTDPRAAFEAMRKRGVTKSGEMAGEETEQKSGFMPGRNPAVEDPLIYNVHHPANYDRIMRALG